MIPIIIIIVLILFSAFFSFSETGLTTLNRARIHRLTTEGSRRAARVGNLIKNKERALSAVLLGNNVVNITASSVATQVFIQYYGAEGAVYATIVITILSLVFGEVIPKTYAYANAEKVALTLSWPISAVVTILSPLTNMVQSLVNSMFRILHINVSEENSAIDTIKETIDLHHSEGEVVKHDKDMLQSVFDLSDTFVREVMIHRRRIISININQKPEKIIAEVLDNIYTRIPVWSSNSDNIIGILHAKALLKEVSQCKGDLSAINWRLVLTDPWFIPDTTSLKDQLFSFREKRNHIALVVDEYGALQGLLTLEDILEEIVGHIDDEQDKAFSGIIKEADGSFIIEGSVSLRDINRLLDWRLPDEKAATLAGLIIEESMTIPDPGEEFEFFNTRFRIIKKHKSQILYIKCWQLEKGEVLSS